MGLGNWKNTSTYSQGDSDEKRSIQTEATLKIEYVRIMIHRHRDIPGQWIMSCNPTVVYRHVLSSETIEEAQVEALTKLRARLQLLVRSLTAELEGP